MPLFKILPKPLCDAGAVKCVSTLRSHDNIRVTKELLADRALGTHCVAL
jgi:hypothetical protein